MKKIVFILIVLLALVLRFYKLGSVPVSLYWDETAIGYNAYAITQTGADEYGTELPLVFRSFDDYKLPGYIYLTAVSVKLFGLSEFSVRLPSALLGVLTVILVFFLVRRLYPKAAFLAAFLVAVSPWALQFSRAGFEATGGLFFLVLGIYLFIVSLSRKYWVTMSVLAFVASTYFYRSLEIIAPVILAVMLLIFAKRMVYHWRIILPSLVLAVLLATPIYYQTFFGTASIRGDQVSIFSQEAHKVTYVQTFLKGYLSHYSPDFLYFSGDPNGRHGVENMGVSYVWEVPALLIGAWLIIKKRSTIGLFLLSWLLICPIPAAVATPTPHALRALNMVIPLEILAAIGLSKLKKKLVVGSLVVVVFFAFFYRYLISYYEISPIKRAADWADGNKQLVSYIQANEAKYPVVIVSGHYWKPYIFFLFYEKYRPVDYQTNGTEKKFAKYIFGGVKWGKGEYELGEVDLPKLANNQHALIALSPEEYGLQKTSGKMLTTIKDSAGNIVFVVSEI